MKWQLLIVGMARASGYCFRKFGVREMGAITADSAGRRFCTVALAAGERERLPSSPCGRRRQSCLASFSLEGGETRRVFLAKGEQG